ncbi:hypothetical protein VTI74DRAFT_11273 [Chaetomium olivicolor]
MPVAGEVVGDHGPRIEGERPHVLGQVAFAAARRVPPEGLGAIPGEDVLVAVQRPAEGAPVVPVLVQCVDDVGFVVPPEMEAQEVLLCQAARYVVLGAHAALEIALVRADEAHEVKRVGRLADEGLEAVRVDERIAKALAVVLGRAPCQLRFGIQEPGGDAVEVDGNAAAHQFPELLERCLKQGVEEGPLV